MFDTRWMPELSAFFARVLHKVTRSRPGGRRRRASNSDLSFFSSSKNFPDLSIVVLNCGEVDASLRCLESIAENLPSCSIEVILSDDCSGTADLKKLLGIKNILILQPEEQLGFARHANWAVAQSHGKHVLLLKSDVELTAGAIDALLNVIKKHGAGLVGPKLIYPSGLLCAAGGIIWDDASASMYGRYDDPAAPQYNYLRETDYTPGAALLFSRQLWDQLEGFDEQPDVAYYEDVDLAFRVRKLGLRAMYVPSATIVQREDGSRRTDLRIGVKTAQVTHQRKFLQRWSSELKANHYPNGACILRARDRAKNGKVALVIDHYIPEPDRDAGSRNIVEIIKSLRAKSWRIKFWPDNLYFNANYARALQDLEIETLYKPWVATFHKWFSEYGDQIDLVFFSRPTIAPRYIKIVRDKSPKTPTVFYGHDLHFARLKMQATVLNSRKLARQGELMERVERKIWKAVDLALYPSKEEAETARILEPTANIEAILPFCFDVFPTLRRAPTNRDLMFVGGFMHAPNVDAALWLVQAILPIVRRSVPDARLWIVGSNPTTKVKSLAADNVFVAGYISAEALDQKYQTVRAAVVPLRFGAGIKLKVVEALHQGVPLVLTSIGAQGLPGVADVAVVADDPEKIAAAVVDLLTDDEAWYSQSNKELAFARKHFSREASVQAIDRATAFATREAFKRNDIER
jgi:O-antigen biosynthesis protein